jgi:hypothetical protein
MDGGKLRPISATTKPSLRDLRSKFEYRNPKSETNSNDQRTNFAGNTQSGRILPQSKTLPRSPGALRNLRELLEYGSILPFWSLAPARIDHVLPDPEIDLIASFFRTRIQP